MHKIWFNSEKITKKSDAEVKLTALSVIIFAVGIFFEIVFDTLLSIQYHAMRFSPEDNYVV